MDRRIFLAITIPGAAGAAYWGYQELVPAESDQVPPGPARTVAIAEFSNAGILTGVHTVEQVLKSDRAWRQQLSYAAFQVTRHAGTESPYSGQYWDYHQSGLYRCICCSSAMFSSTTKFDSGTGWPSFWEPLARENIDERSDRSLGVERIAVACRRCEAHLGHVFDDGPEPTGLRYCINSVALQFVQLA